MKLKKLHLLSGNLDLSIICFFQSFWNALLDESHPFGLHVITNLPDHEITNVRTWESRRLN